MSEFKDNRIEFYNSDKGFVVSTRKLYCMKQELHYTGTLTDPQQTAHALHSALLARAILPGSNGDDRGDVYS